MSEEVSSNLPISDSQISDSQISDYSISDYNLTDRDVTAVSKINTSRSTLIIILIVIIVLIIIAALIYLLIYTGNVHTIVTETTILQNSGHCVPPQSSLPDISSQLCCENFGILTANKYLASLNLTVSLNPTPYLDLCSSFCTQGYSSSLGTCNGNIPIDIQQFNNCVTASKPVNCTDVANPVAVSNGQYMYGFATGQTFCTTQTTCSLSF